MLTGMLKYSIHCGALWAQGISDEHSHLEGAYQHLQIQLWRNPHIELHVKVMMMSDEGPCSGPSRYHIHHGGLHLNSRRRLSHNPSSQCVQCMSALLYT